MIRAFASGLPTALVSAYRNKRWVLHVLAIVTTYMIVTSGSDWAFFEATRTQSLLNVALPAALIGFFVPLVLPVALFVAGEISKRPRLRLASITIAQAGICALLISSSYKAFTGRIQPEFLTTLGTQDISRQFQFGFLRHGVFWGWPSSHASVAWAMSVALAREYRRPFVVGSALLYALFIAFGVSISIHWLSDAIAGILVGSAVGLGVSGLRRT